MATIFQAYEVPIAGASVRSSTGASYTVPINRYAIVRAEATVGSAFTIGGVAVLRSKLAGGIAASTSQAASGSGVLLTATEFCTVQCGFVSSGGGSAVKIDYRYSGASGTSYNLISQTGAGNFASVLFQMAAGDTLFVTNGASSSTSFWASAMPAQTDGGNVGTFKLNAGDTISGGRYSLELYKIPGAAS